LREKLRSVKLLQGNEACVEGAIAAGARFFAGYPITPSSEIAEGLAERLPQVGGKFIQMEDEIGAMAAVIGASLTGLKSMTATSGPGFSLKMENLGFACMTEIPCVVVNVMRGGPSTGLPTSPGQADVMQARWGTHGDHPTIALAPASVRDIFETTILSFNFAERYRTPVILLLDEIVGHLREKMEIPDPSEIQVVDRKKPSVPPEEYLPYANDPSDVPPMANFGEGYRYHVTGLNHDERGYPTSKPELVAAQEARLLRKIERHRKEIVRFERVDLEDAEVAIFAFGSTARSAKLAVQLAREKGVRAGLFRAITLWPFPEEEIEELASRSRILIVAEMNLGQMVYEVERCAHGRAPIVRVNRADGEPITPDQILERILEVAR
jgi:2-oxoglutarate ferredoxin oxidoreductase subunit alpha